jgi:hydrogenase expression/formation protein HypC
MCLGVPGRIVRWLEREPPLACGEIEFDGSRRICNLACVPEAAVGDYVIVHAGVAITRLDADEAARLLEELRSLCEPTVPEEPHSPPSVAERG